MRILAFLLQGVLFANQLTDIFYPHLHCNTNEADVQDRMTKVIINGQLDQYQTCLQCTNRSHVKAKVHPYQNHEVPLQFLD